MKAHPLNLSKTLQLPIEAVTQTFAVLGIRGSGKTNTAVVLCEELLQQQQQVVVIDPVDVWWGLRSSSTGKQSGYAVTILGGEHADLPLEATAGKLIAEFAVEQHASLILSLRHFSKADQKRFAADFAERLYELKGRDKNKQPLQLVVDECDEFVPQRIQHGGERLFGAFDTLVRRGRSSGLGVTLISQRAQVVNKDVLSQVETLVCHRVLHKLDRAAVEAWIEAHDVHGRKQDFLDSLASLGKGQAWVWSPEWLNVFERVNIRYRSTFDSSATPKAGARPVAPRHMAPVDLEQLRTRMAETLERAKADNPAELQKRIRQLETEIRNAKPAAPGPPDPDALKQAYERGQRDAGQSAARLKLKLQKIFIDALASLEALAAGQGPHQSKLPQQQPQPTYTDAHTAAEQIREKTRQRSSSNGNLSAGEQRILTVLAQYPHGRTSTQVALLTGYASGSGNFSNLLSSLRSKGYADGSRSALRITADGMAAVGPDFQPLPTGDALLQYWYGKLSKAERAILEQLATHWPAPLSAAEVAERTGYAAASGNFNNAISRLRTLELISGSRAELQAARTFFE